MTGHVVRQRRADAHRIARSAEVDRIIVALDPVNFEKAYAQKIEGISQVYKSTPPGSVPSQDARITNGYPSIIAQIVNTPQLALPYAHLFSYTTEDFLSENQELKRAMRTIRSVLRGLSVCLVADAGLDDRKLFRYAATCDLDFVIRAKSERNIEVYNQREDRWEPEKLLSLAETYPGSHRFETVFTHAGDTVTARVCLDWFHFRIPATGQRLWAIVATTTKVAPDSQDNAAAQWLNAFPNPLVLITNRPVQQAECAQQVYADWRLRPGIEHLNRFIQEDGVDIEKIQLRTLERFRRQFILVLATALFVLRLPDVWHPAIVHWLRQLGSAVASIASDRGGPYLLLRGVQRILDAFSVLVRCASHPPPSDLPCKAQVPT